MTFWKTATKDQRLAQIDGGIECGLCAADIAVMLGTTADCIRHYASRYGRSLRKDYEAAKRNGHKGGIVGGIVNARRMKKPETSQPSAFSIFESPSDPGLFDRHPND
jgi:hypothetical protein